MSTYWILVSILVAYINFVSGCPQRCRCNNNVVDCSNKRMRNPPKIYPSDTHMVNLNNNSFSVLGPRSFKSLESLEILKISGNRIRVIRSQAFRPFSNLLTLDLSNNQLLKMYGRGLKGISKLRTLSLSNNKMKSVSRIFTQIPNIFQLNLAFNNIRKLGESDFTMNTDLHYLDLRNNRIASIHRNTFKNLVMLRTLFLNNNPLVNLPTLTFGSNILQLIDFSECELTEIPKRLPSSVGDLRLGKNKLTRVNQTDLENLTGLKMIQLNQNEIEIFEYFAVGNAVDLEEVWLRNNKLVYIPRGLPNSVKKIHMHSNMVHQIEGLLFSNNSMLEFLDITNNRVENISSEAFNGLSKLQTLNFESNQIEDIQPGTFTNLINLTFLYLGNNPIQTIQDGAFINLPNLTTLTLNYNPVEEVSIGENFIQQTPKLQKLNLMASLGMTKSLLSLLEDSEIIMTDVSEVILTYNNLHKLSSKFKEVFPNVKKLPLDGNAWICDHELLWLKQWMDIAGSDVTFHEYSPSKCDTPFSLSGQDIQDVPESNFVRHDENLLNDFPYWIIEDEFTKEAKDREIQEKKDREQKDKEHKAIKDEKGKSDSVHTKNAKDQGLVDSRINKPKTSNNIDADLKQDIKSVAINKTSNKNKSRKETGQGRKGRRGRKGKKRRNQKRGRNRKGKKNREGRKRENKQRKKTKN